MIESLSVIELIWKMLEGIVKGYDSKKKDIFEIHVEPLMEKIQMIYKDYIDGFTEFRYHLIKRTKPSSELLDFLQERRRDNAHVRQLVSDMGEKLKNLRRMGMNGEDIKALESFSGAIVNYFMASSELGAFSWYSHLIETVRWQSEYDVDIIPDVWQTSTITGYTPDVLLKEVDEMLNMGLPNAFRDVSETYANLRVRFL